MAVESASDRAVFVSADDWGVTATYSPSTGPDITLAGIFDKAHAAIEMGNGVAVSTVAPMFHCRDDDLQTLQAGGARENDAVIIAGLRYIVRDIQPDGTGMTMLILKRA